MKPRLSAIASTVLTAFVVALVVGLVHGAVQDLAFIAQPPGSRASLVLVLAFGIGPIPIACVAVYGVGRTYPEEEPIIPPLFVTLLTGVFVLILTVASGLYGPIARVCAATFGAAWLVSRWRPTRVLRRLPPVQVRELRGETAMRDR